MKAAGLTHGGFYGHFASKDALIAAVVAQSLSANVPETVDIDAWIEAYLSLRHRDAPEQGCPTASLAGLMRQQTPEAQAAMAEGIDEQIVRLAEALPSGTDAERRRAAIGRWSALVGALILSRAVGTAPLSDEILSETRSWIGSLRKEVA